MEVRADLLWIQLDYACLNYMQKIGKIARIKECVKLHTALDVDTGIILSARVTLFRVHDTGMLIPLFNDIDYLTELYADKRYNSLRNIMYVEFRSAVPYIAIKSNASKGLRKTLLIAVNSPVRKRKYGNRNKIESTYHSLKSLRSAIISSYFEVLAYNLFILFRLSFLSPPMFSEEFNLPSFANHHFVLHMQKHAGHNFL